MILPFSLVLNGKKTFFIEKIWLGLIENGFQSYSECNQYQKKHLSKFGELWDHDEDKNLITRQTPKIHTIRCDNGDIWKPGMKIHFVINNRSKNRFQFAPVFQVVSIQQIEIGCKMVNGTKWKYVLIDNEKMLSWEKVESLAYYDGFESINDFFQYFTKGKDESKFIGKLIHWTNKTY